jgi:TniQ
MDLLFRPQMILGEGLFGYRARLAELNALPRQVIDRAKLKPSGEYGKVIQALEAKKAPMWIRTRRRFCPHCLKEHAYWRIGWEVQFIDACPEHANWLIDKCIQCHQPLVWARGTLTHCGCGADLRDEKAGACPPAVMQLAAAMTASITGETHSLPCGKGLDVAQFVRLVRLFGAYLSGPLRARPQKITVEALEVSWHYSSFAAEVLAGWPNAFDHVLRQMYQSRCDPQSGRLKDGWGGFYAQIYVAYREPEFSFVRTAFENHVAVHWCGPLGRRNRRLSNDLIEKAAWIPAKHAWQKLGVSQRRFEQLIQDGALTAETRSGPSGRSFLFVKRVEVENLTPSVTSDVTLETAASMLGVTRARARRIIPRLVPALKKLSLPAGFEKRWAIPRERIDELIELTRRQKRSRRGGKHAVSIRHLLKYAKWSPQEIVQLLRAALIGKINPVGRADGEHPVDLMFLRKDLESWRALVSPEEDVMTIPDVADQLRVKQEVAYHLVRKGLLVTQGRDQNTGGALVHVDALREFNNNYVFASDQARQLGRSPTYLIDYLAIRGIAQAAGPRIDGCRQTVFLRSPELRAAIMQLSEVRAMNSPTDALKSVAKRKEQRYED